MMGEFTIDQHRSGIARLVEPDWTKHSDLSKLTSKQREKWLLKLCHYIEPHPKFSAEPPKGDRDEKSLQKTLESLGAGKVCYVVASDDQEHDDTLQPLENMIRDGYELFGHGTFLSCVPGQLALFRTAWPHKHLIVHRPKD